MIEHEFNAVWNKYREKLFSFFASRVESRETAEDLLQETFLRIHSGLCCLAEREHMEPFVYRIARNLLIDHYRARRSETEYADTAESPYPGAIAGALTIARRKVVCLVVVVLWAGSIIAGYGFDVLSAAQFAFR